ncbi:MAG: DsrE family protein [Bacteroidales bacterium]
MNNEKLTVLWTSGEKDVALKVVLRYIDNALQKQVWGDVELIIWGPSVQLAGDDENVKFKLESLLQRGLKAKACIVCAEEYGVSQVLEQMGVELSMVGEELTHLIQDQRPLLSL